MNETTRTALLAEIHAAIEKSAESVLRSILEPNSNPHVTYPPNADLTPAEIEALRTLRLSEPARSGLSKLIKDAAAHPFFHFFCLLDGVADPPAVFNGETVFETTWSGLSLAPKGDDDDETSMLHDAFYESYWAYRPPTEQT